MVFFDALATFIYFYLFIKIIWANLYKILFVSLVYFSFRVGIAQQQLNTLSEKNKLFDEYYKKSIVLTDKCWNTYYDKLYINQIADYIILFLKVTRDLVQYLCDLLENKLRENNSVDNLLVGFDEYFKNLNKIRDKMVELWNNFDVKKTYELLQKLDKVNKTLNEEMLDDNIFDDEPNNILLDKLPTKLLNDKLMNNLFKQVPPELLNKSVNDLNEMLEKMGSPSRKTKVKTI
jgi:hypothetical protein